ncbi:MAG: hypothetical protein WDM96_17635 [Lacunisphaera sp.]
MRAGIVSVDRLGDYRHGSYWYLRRKAQRPAWLRLDLVLAQTGGLVDAAAGWASYADYLHWQMSEGPLGRADAYKKMSRGWALGSAEFKTALVKDHAVAALARAWEASGAREIREQAWEDQCRRALAVLGRDEVELEHAPGQAPWKTALAAFLKERSQAANSWLGRRLHIGCAKYVSRLASAASHAQPPIPELATLRGHGET